MALSKTWLGTQIIYVYVFDFVEGKDTVDCIMERITDPSKTRGQIIRELKRQELIESAKDLKKPKT